MINTPAIRREVQKIIDTEFNGNVKQFSEKYNGISRPSWIDIISGKTKSIKSPAAINSLCKMFHCSEMGLFKISNPEDYEPELLTVNEKGSSYCTRDPEIQLLCQWMESDAPEETKKAIFAVAKAGGFIAPGSLRSGRVEYPSAARAS